MDCVASYEKKKDQPEEPILARAKRARVLRIQDEIDRCSEPLIGEKLSRLLPCFFRHITGTNLLDCEQKSSFSLVWFVYGNRLMTIDGKLLTHIGKWI